MQSAGENRRSDHQFKSGLLRPPFTTSCASASSRSLSCMYRCVVEMKAVQRRNRFDRQPINASIARRIGSARVGQALTTLTKFGSVVSNPVSTGSPDTGTPRDFRNPSRFPTCPAFPSFWPIGEAGDGLTVVSDENASMGIGAQDLLRTGWKPVLRGVVPFAFAFAATDDTTSFQGTVMARDDRPLAVLASSLRGRSRSGHASFPTHRPAAPGEA